MAPATRRPAASGLDCRVDPRHGGHGGQGKLVACKPGRVPLPLVLEQGQDLEVAEPVGQDGQGVKLVAAEGQNSQYRSTIRAATPASIRRAFRIPVKRLLSATGGC